MDELTWPVTITHKLPDFEECEVLSQQYSEIELHKEYMIVRARYKLMVTDNKIPKEENYNYKYLYLHSRFAGIEFTYNNYHKKYRVLICVDGVQNEHFWWFDKLYKAMQLKNILDLWLLGTLDKEQFELNTQTSVKDENK